MHDLNKYISGLLFIHDCVILPGFGGLVTNYHNAEHDELSNTFYPPKKDVLFNKNLTYNDGLMINYLAKNLNISYKDAERRIKEEVQKAWLELDKGREVSFNGVGSFKYDKDQNLVFSPEDSENFLTDSYGLSSFRFPPLNYEKNAHNIIPIHKHSQMDEGVKKTIKWAAAAVAVIAVAVLSLIPYQKSKNTQQTAVVSFDTANEQPIEQIHSAMPADTNVHEVIEQVTDKRQALFYNEESKPVEKKQITDGLTFYIIGGSYKDEANAIENVGFFKDKGFNASVIESNDLYRVSLGKFDNKVNALHELRRIRNEEKNDKVWLLSLR